MQCLLLTYMHCLRHSASAKSASALCHSAKVLKVRQGCKVQSESARQLKFCFRQRSEICESRKSVLPSPQNLELRKSLWIVSQESDYHYESNNPIIVGIIDSVTVNEIHPYHLLLYCQRLRECSNLIINFHENLQLHNLHQSLVFEFGPNFSFNDFAIESSV